MTYNWIVKKPETAAAIYKAACTTPEQVAAIAAKFGDEVLWTGAVQSGSRGLKDIDTIVADILREIGIPASVLGYQYVREAIKMTAQNMSLVNNITKALYPATAEKFGTTASRVERAIRHAVELAFDRGDVETLQRYFGCSVSAAKGKPTNSEFIATLADRIARGAA